MREIKFRGRSEGKWYYGSLITSQVSEETAVIKATFCYYICYNYYSQQVEEDTVGQFTSLKDKNGKEIYEGDIIETTRDEKMYTHKEMKRCRVVSIVEWDSKEAKFFEREIVNEGRYRFSSGDFVKCKVIGNVYENPELVSSIHQLV